MNRNDFRLRLRALFFRRRMDSELDEEISAHLELQTRKHIHAGMSPEEAKRRAHLDFGALENTKEDCRDSRQIAWLSHLAQDLRYAVRSFRRAPGLTGLMILVLALGMGANLATFSVADAILLRMLPVRDPASLFRTAHANGDAYDSGGGGSYPVFKEMQKRTRPFADLMAYQAADPALIAIGRSEPSRLMHETVSGNYFEVLGVRPVIGRMISPEDDREPGRQAVAVISYELWQTRFNKSERVLGSKLQFDHHTFDIIGVAPAAFFGVEVGKMVDVWTPISMAPVENLTNDHMFWLRLMGRVHPGVTVAQAAAPMQAVMNEIMLEDVRLHAPPGTPKQIIDRFLQGMRIKGVPAGGGISYLRGQYRQPLEIMLFVVGLVLLIACSNVANLLIAKGAARQQEIAIRLSLGAGRARILQQLVTESLLLAFLAAAIGLLLAHWSIPILVRLLTPSTQPARLATGIDSRLLAFTMFLMLLTVLICGLMPALRSAGKDMQPVLKGNTAAGTGNGTLKKALGVSQVAFSLVLVVGAVLFTRTLVNLMSSYLGFQPNDILIARIAFQPSSDPTNRLSAWKELLRRVRSIPGIDHASLSSGALFTGDPPLVGVRTTASQALPADPITGQLFVSDDYLETLGIKLTAGRSFAVSDNDSTSPPCVIVNQAFARKFFGDENPLGRQLTKLANAPVWTKIVGIVQNARYNSLRGNAPPMIYVPFGRIQDWIPAQAHPGDSMFLQMRERQGTGSIAAEMRREIGPRFTMGQISRQQQLIDDTLVRERLLANIASFFGGLALLLAALGLYAIMSYAIVQRRQEVGTRIALGAAPGTILSLMLRDSAVIVGLGTIIGIAASASLFHLAKALLFGLAPNDPISFAVSALILLAVSLVAAFVPAYRAARTDPMTALRHE